MGERLPIGNINHKFYKGAYILWTLGFIALIVLKYVYYSANAGTQDGETQLEFIQKDIIRELKVLLPLTVAASFFFAVFLHLCSITLTH